ncbi:MAG: GDP-mannose 4,6-dehydratase, partial [Thermoplasmata archaeon]
TNVYGTHVILDVAKEYWQKNDMFNSARFLQISTDEVYGSLPLESEEKFTEFPVHQKPKKMMEVFKNVGYSTGIAHPGYERESRR